MITSSFTNRNNNLDGVTVPDGSALRDNHNNKSTKTTDVTNNIRNSNNMTTGDILSSSFTTAETISNSQTTSEKLQGSFSESSIDAELHEATSTDNSQEPTYAPEVTKDELIAELKLLRKNTKFLELEAKAESKVGEPIKYEIDESGVGNTISNESTVYIGRYLKGYCYTSNGKNGMSFEEDNKFFNNDASLNTPRVQVPFSVKRVIVHEVAHHTLGIFNGSEANVISVTNEIMSDFGEHPRVLSHEGYLIDKDRF